MVVQIDDTPNRPFVLSVLALSSRFDGLFVYIPPPMGGIHLSVLALSSRFDGPRPRSVLESPWVLSVLALSSRFDGLL